jgi:hypothetical protein
MMMIETMEMKMMNYPQSYLGIRLVCIPSGMGGVLPAAVAAEHEDGTTQVVCLHEEFFPNWLLTVKTSEIKPNTYRLSEFAQKIIRERVRKVA